MKPTAPVMPRAALLAKKLANSMAPGIEEKALQQGVLVEAHGCAPADEGAYLIGKLGTVSAAHG